MSSKEIFRAFKSRGLVIKADASKELQQLLDNDAEPQRVLTAALDEIQSRIEKRMISSTLIDLATISSVIRELVQETDDDGAGEEMVQIIDAFSTPKLTYDDKNKSYDVAVRRPAAGSRSGPRGRGLHTSVEARAQMYRQRYLLIQQRLLRTGSFTLRGMANSQTPKSAGSKPAGFSNADMAGRSGDKSGGQQSFEISTIESLLGSSPSVPRILLGYVTQPEEEGAWYLEDLSTSIVKLDVSKLLGGAGCAVGVGAGGKIDAGNSIPAAQSLDSMGGAGSSNRSSNRIFMEGVVVLVQGFVAANRSSFVVHHLRFPPAESREVSKHALGRNTVVELWGAGVAAAAASSKAGARGGGGSGQPSPSSSPAPSPRSPSSPGGNRNGGRGDLDTTLMRMLRPQYWETLEAREAAAAEQRMIFLSDLQLDRPHVLEKLQVLFQTYETLHAEQLELWRRRIGRRKKAGGGGGFASLDVSLDDNDSGAGIAPNYSAESMESSDEAEEDEVGEDEHISAALPPMFVLIGPFVSQPDLLSYAGRECTQQAFDALAKLLIQCCPRLLCGGRFVFVPGPRDVGGGNALPLFPLSTLFTEQLSRQLTQFIREKAAAYIEIAGEVLMRCGVPMPPGDGSNIVFTTNPTRLHYCAQEIVVFRDDVMRKMQRHARFLPRPPKVVGVDAAVAMEGDAEDEEAEEDEDSQRRRLVVECLLDEAHLCPLLPYSNGGSSSGAPPIYWEYDDALRLFPLPDLLVLADRCEEFQHTYQGCQAANPGSFAADFSFMVYYPASRRIEPSKLQ